MPTRVYITAYVPAALRDSAESLVAVYLTSPNDPGVMTFGVPLVPVGGPADATPSHYGVCSALLDDSGLFAALPALAAALPGATYAVVSPWRTFLVQRDWLDWLAARGLKPYSAA